MKNFILWTIIAVIFILGALAALVGLFWAIWTLPELSTAVKVGTTGLLSVLLACFMATFSEYF